MKSIRTMAIITFAIMAVIAFAVVANAQERQSVEERIAEMDKVVSLTADQKTKITELYKSRESASSGRSREDRMRNRGNRGGRRGGGRGGFGGRLDPEVAEILTEEQVEKYRKFQSERQIQRRIDQLDESLKLKDAQKDKLRAILAEDAKKMAEVMAGMPEDQDARREYFSKFRDMREASNENIKKVLTKNQAKIFDEEQEAQNERRRQRQNQ